MSFRANQKGVLIVLAASIGSWFMGAMAIFYVKVAIYTIVTGLNITVGVTVFMFHTLGNPKVLLTSKQLKELQFILKSLLYYRRWPYF